MSTIITNDGTSISYKPIYYKETSPLSFRTDGLSMQMPGMHRCFSLGSELLRHCT
jgi:hypothetical protein